MAILKWQKETGLNPTFHSFFNDWMNDGYFDKVAIGTSIPAVNIKDAENNFMIHLAAPGLKKEDFKLSLENKVLTVSSEQKAEKEEKGEGKFTRKEYSYSSFSRSFTLPESVDVESIDASYENGELVITLPKKAKAEPKQISIK